AGLRSAPARQTAGCELLACGLGPGPRRDQFQRHCVSPKLGLKRMKPFLFKLQMISQVLCEASFAQLPLLLWRRGPGRGGRLRTLIWRRIGRTPLLVDAPSVPEPQRENGPLTPTLSPPEGERENCRMRRGGMCLSLSPAEGERAGVRGHNVSTIEMRPPFSQRRFGICLFGIFLGFGICDLGFIGAHAQSLPIRTLAGAVTPGSTNGFGSNARFNHPEGLALDTGGNLYVADTWNHTIRKITPAGVVSTLAGLAGNFGAADGTNSKARFYRPASIAVDSAANLYVADSFNHTIRTVTPAGKVSTIAGVAGIWGSADGTNSDARFYLPQGISIAATGEL